MILNLCRLIFLLCCGSACGMAAEAVTWTVDIAMDSQIFPSLTYSMANLRADEMMIGKRKVRRLPQDFAMPEALAKRPFIVRFSQLSTGSKATIRVKSDGIMDPVSLTVDLGKTQLVHIPVAFAHDALVRNRQSKPANIDFVVSIDGGTARKVTRPVTVRSINDCPYFFVTSKATGRGFDLSWMFAA